MIEYFIKAFLDHILFFYTVVWQQKEQDSAFPPLIYLCSQVYSVWGLYSVMQDTPGSDMGVDVFHHDCTSVEKEGTWAKKRVTNALKNVTAMLNR